MNRSVFRLSVAALACLIATACMVPIGPKTVRITSDAPNTTVEVRKPQRGQGPKDGWTKIGVIAEAGGELKFTDDRTGLQFRATAPGYEERLVTRTDLPPVIPFDLTRLSQAPPPGPGPNGDPGGGPTINIDVELPPFTGQRYALIIGVSKYSSTGFEELPNARADAEAIGEVLRNEQGGNMDKNRVKVLIDEDATRGQILKDLEVLLERTNDGDMIMIYFAGHGEGREGQKPKRYLMAYDSQADQVRTGIDQEEILEILDKRKVAKRQFVVLDCCHAGGVAGLRNSGTPNMWESMVGGKKGRVVMTSTLGNETAIDGPRGGNSPFAKCFIEAVKGRAADSNRDGLSAKEIFDSVYNRVRAEARQQRDVSMTPQIYGRDWADEVLLVK